jgi:Tol biopolymer transport system component
MPDGKNILYAFGNQLNVISLDTEKSISFAAVPGRAFWLRWSPDGKRLRFTIINSVNHTSSLWQIEGGQHIVRPLLKDWDLSHDECCGIWTADGANYIFQATIDGRTDLWKMSGDAASHPVQVTNGPLYYESPVAARSKDEIFFVGHDYHSRTETFDAAAKQFVPLNGFLSHALRVSFSRDRRAVIWIDPVGRLWRAEADGTDKVQLTPESMSVFLATWSPDGTQVALMARYPEHPWQVFILNANGGNPELLMRGNQNVADPSFSPDGKSIAFGGVPDLMGQGNTPRSIQILDLASKRITDLADSSGLFSPRWSPDGRYIAALTLDQQKVMLYDMAARTWRVLAVTSAADPVWSSDSKALYVHAYMDPADPICRIDVQTGHLDQIAGIRNFSAGAISRYFFDGLTPENVPIVHTEVDSSNLYSMDLASPGKE